MASSSDCRSYRLHASTSWVPVSSYTISSTFPQGHCLASLSIKGKGGIKRLLPRGVGKLISIVCSIKILKQYIIWNIYGSFFFNLRNKYIKCSCISSSMNTRMFSYQAVVTQASNPSTGRQRRLAL